MTKEEILRLEDAVVAALRPQKQLHEEWARRAARYAATCTISKASFSQSRPPVPIVTLKNGKCQPVIKVVQGCATFSVARATVVGHDLSVEKELVDVIIKLLPRVEQGVEAAAKRLLADPAAVAKKKAQLKREADEAKRAKRDRMLREFRTLVKEGWNEEDLVEVYREAVVAVVHDS